MDEINVIKILKNQLGFSDLSINRLKEFHDYLLEHNKRLNLISKSTEKNIWFRHILDSAQLIKFIDFISKPNIIDLGSGAGFPGLIIALHNNDIKFHVKLYEKSAKKRAFLELIKDKLSIENISIKSNIYEEKINSDIVVCRAFKKLNEIMRISREIIQKPHKLIILKGKNAQSEINNLSLDLNYGYNLKNSITEHDSKIIIVDAK